MTFAEKLQSYRKSTGLSQEELAYQLGVSRQSVSKWEQGLSFPETEKLIELSTMMGMSVDQLLKDAAPPVPQKKPIVKRTPWIISTVLLLVAVLVISALLLLPQPEEPVQENTPPAGAESAAFETADLQQLQSWFFDFAREYRLDYMPRFTAAEGAPVDATEYLYWVFAVNLEHWGEDKGTMTKVYVEETVQQYFGIVPGQHRTMPKAWNFDQASELYTAWPEGIRPLPYFLLNGITAEQDSFTVHATCYTPAFLADDAEDTRLQAALLAGDLSEFSAVSEVSVTFHLNYINFNRPKFTACIESFS